MAECECGERLFLGETICPNCRAKRRSVPEGVGDPSVPLDGANLLVRKGLSDSQIGVERSATDGYARAAGMVGMVTGFGGGLAMAGFRAGLVTGRAATGPAGWAATGAAATGLAGGGVMVWTGGAAGAVTTGGASVRACGCSGGAVKLGWAGGAWPSVDW